LLLLHKLLLRLIDHVNVLALRILRQNLLLLLNAELIKVLLTDNKGFLLLRLLLRLLNSKNLLLRWFRLKENVYSYKIKNYGLKIYYIGV